ncbi:MAG: UTP--glucose-1-phosphate uridylyltransferase, partial [Actinomycetales bacterium]
MSDAGLAAAQEKMREAGVVAGAIQTFSHYYRQLESGVTGIIAEDDITPMDDPVMLDQLKVDDDQARDAIGKTVIIKLNGGLGTSMGLDKAKSLLQVRDGKTFLDIIVDQVMAARAKYGVQIPLLFMNSFRTREESLEVLAKYPELPVAGLPLDFIQNQEPKLRADDLTPVRWLADRTLEWCPPGHGDLYNALLGSGILNQLIDAGYRYACASNGDNLGAGPDATIAGWFASSGAPYA